MPYDHNHTNTEDAPLWGFTSLVSAERRGRLLRLKRFDEVLHEIISTSDVLDYEAEPFHSSSLQGCVRASFLLSVTPRAYDGFFNSPVGYRAQYCIGHGTSANRQAIAALKPKLTEFAELRATGTFGLNRIVASLDAADAKIWIDESESGSAPSENLEIHIDYPPWIERARCADASQDEEMIKAVRGVFAPVGTRLEVKGGWLGSDGSEIRDPTKAQRGDEIAKSGYT